MGKLKRASSKKVIAAKEGVWHTLNINRYNKYLFILETILLVGVVDEFFEGLIMGLNVGLYLHVFLLMFSIGVLFVFALALIEKIGKGTIVWLVRLSNNKILRVVFHVLILCGLFYLYAKVFFGVEIGLVFNIGLNAS
jgi:hypothetical protein